jgi:hypothetical protein
MGPPLNINWARQVLLRTTSGTARLKCAGAPSCMYSTLPANALMCVYIYIYIFFLVLVCGTRA